MFPEEEIKNEEFKFYENYPLFTIFLRWLLLGAAFGLGIYILFQIKDILAYFYILYGILCLMLVLPLSRCVYCYYHDRICDCGFGKVASFLFPKNDESKYKSKYVYFSLTYPFWFFPALFGIIQILRERSLKALIIFLVFILILLLERIFLRFAGCKNCHQRNICPGVPFCKS
jgi:hypothetical protein